MKLAPLFNCMGQNPAFLPLLVHTGQHYDDNMSGSFLRDLRLPTPHYFLNVGSGSHAQQTAEIMKRFEPILLERKPDGVIVAGDVNSTVACALVAAKLRTPVIHIESGLRSFDRSMPEEINRILTDAISDLLLVTEESGVRNLRAEGVSPERIHLVGNMMIDSLRANLEAARGLNVPTRFGLRNGSYGVVTLHRPANVDERGALQEILDALNQIAQQMPLLFPVHPRTLGRLHTAVLHPNIRAIEPLGYLEFLGLTSACAVVLTDSGGLQEETTALGVPCLTLRNNTERPATIEQGTNRLAGTTRQSILAAWEQFRQNPPLSRIPPLWDGLAAGRAMDAVSRYYQAEGRV